jgi:hypothetical protein
MFHPDKHIVVSDLDGCLVNIYQELQKHLWDLYSVWVPQEAITDYRVDGPIWRYLTENRPRTVFLPKETLKAPSKPELEKVLNTFWAEPKGYVQAKPYHMYWQALLDWYWAGGQIKFITARPKSVHEATVSWLLSWGLMMGPDVLERNVTFTEKGPHDSGKERAQFIESLSGSGKDVVFLDDRRETCEEVASTPIGRSTTIILTKRPWNAFPNHANPHRIRRLTDEMLVPLLSVV